MRVLITNDDGWAAPGIRALAAAVHATGHDVVVVAPEYESSGVSAALSATVRHGRIIVCRVKLPGLDGVPVHRVAATPAYIAVLADLGTFGPRPDVVLSGINRGANAGHAVMHSGTVGATLVAARNGVRAMAVSLDVLSPVVASERSSEASDAAGRTASERSSEASDAAGRTTSSSSGGAAIAALDTVDDETRNWATAAGFARRLLPRLLDLPAGTLLNLNVPDRPEAEVRGVRQATLAPFGQVQMALAETGEDYVRVAVEESGARAKAGTDLAVLAEGYASVTPLRPISDAPEITLML